MAVAPLEQSSRHDDNETIASAWVRPRDALGQHERAELTMMPPTIKNLEFVGAHDDAESAMAAARRIGQPPAIQPKLRRDANGRVRGIAMPDDPDYADLD